MGIFSRFNSADSFCCRKDYDDNPEAKGFVIASGGRSPAVIYDALFSVVAYNAFAVAIADCNGNILGGSILFTSAVATLATVEGVLTPVLSPILGGIADTTPNRKLYLGVSFAFVVLTLVAQGVLYLSEPTEIIDPADNSTVSKPLFDSDAAFYAISGAILINVVTYELASLLTISYSPELTTDDTKQMGFVADSYAANNGSQLVFLGLSFGLFLFLEFDELEQGAIGAFICAAYCTIVFFRGFVLLDSRRDIDPDLDKKCLGVPSLLRAIVFMALNYKEVLKYLISWMFVSGAVTNSVSLAATYLQTYLGFPGSQVSILLGLALVAAVPGSILSRVWIKAFNFKVKNVYIAVSVIYGLTFFSSSFLLTAERLEGQEALDAATLFGRCDLDEVNVTGDPAPVFESSGGTFFAAVAFVLVNGLMLGHIYPLNTQFYALLIPGGQENIYFGMKITFAKALAWLPALLFLVISEVNNGDLRLALLPVGGMFIIGAIVAFFIDVEKGKEDVAHTLKHRQGQGKILDPEAEKNAEKAVVADI